MTGDAVFVAALFGFPSRAGAGGGSAGVETKTADDDEDVTFLGPYCDPITLATFTVGEEALGSSRAFHQSRFA